MTLEENEYTVSLRPWNGHEPGHVVEIWANKMFSYHTWISDYPDTTADEIGILLCDNGFDVSGVRLNDWRGPGDVEVLGLWTARPDATVEP